MEPIGKFKQILLYAGSFPALAFFKIWASSGMNAGRLAFVALLMLIFCAGVILLAYRWDKPSYFDWAIGAYFAVISLSLAVWPAWAGHLLARYSVTGIYVFLFAAAFFPPLLGMDPFTYHYARKYTPEAVWTSSVFIRINRIMTYVWAGVFAFCAVLSLYPSVITRAFIPLGVILGIGLPFNLRFPDFYLRRLGLPTTRAMKGVAVGQVPSSKEESPAPEEQQPKMASDANDHDGEFKKPDSKKRKDRNMKVLAVNSSPRGGDQSKTGLMLSHLVEGMRDAGAEVEVVELRKKKIRYCSGCFTCWTKTPGVCIHKDDMTAELLPKFMEADLVVYASPLYHFTVNAEMKAFIERTLPMIQPFFEEGDNLATRHPVRHELPKVVILSVAGFPEMSVFDQLSSWVRFIFGQAGNLVAEIYRPAAESMTQSFLKDEARRILEATRQAGREIVQSNKVSDETMALVTKEIFSDKESFRKMGNLFWKTCITEGVSPREFDERGMTPRPDSIETLMMILPLGFNPAGAGDTKAVIQFSFQGDVEGACSFRIEDGTIAASQGPAEDPDLTIESPFDLWIDIMTGKADGQEMFMAQKYKVQGDLGLLMRMNQFFGAN